MQYKRHLLSGLLHYSFNSDWLCHSHDLGPPHCRPEGSWEMGLTVVTVQGRRTVLSICDFRCRNVCLAAHTMVDF